MLILTFVYFLLHLFMNIFISTYEYFQEFKTLNHSHPFAFIFLTFVFSKFYGSVRVQID